MPGTDSFTIQDEVNILLAENIAPSAVEVLARAGIHDVRRLPRAVGSADAGALTDVHVLGIRSRTQVTTGLLDAAPALVAVGCFSVGTNQVDLDAARARGIPVFNAPFSNTRSVAELTIGEIVMLLRRITPRSEAAHAGGWDKSAENSYEVRGKTLGIVGYGNIGAQLSNLAEAMGMRVIFFDLTDRLRHGNTEPAESLDALLAASDVVSLHVPETPLTHGLMSAERIGKMKPGAYLINNSRGTVVDLDALAIALKQGRLRGAAVDVFPVEPRSNDERFVSPLQGIPNVILTPHIGGSTEEAQDRIGSEVARKLVDYVETGSTLGAVNFPQVQIPPRIGGVRFLHVHRNVPGVLGHVNQAFARRDVNIASQYLQTEGELGYVVVEADAAPAERAGILAELDRIEGTVRTRLIQARIA
ncbi:phosphoglycerate dehydrogenase [Methylorubrum rhodesianum]|jgi:D-3-phosphoglycerate dehydrogenase|uniref:phosphoglycerate dehydrogenase n=1 Tax=Methylorubrum TaxID=2282523 RepID=UPI00161CB3AA|nr:MULTISPECIES: phosphoglycerate dehydrogenase [Methylorubrum]MBB5761074.1 D-3-phosphoglycerate dehydrogenase [Methylorubrum rhodesianum]MBI1687892.1 phosphoglycerate dehydrogenase [Methylorubrum sp. DB1722]